jgi:hypothetical protein
VVDCVGAPAGSRVDIRIGNAAGVSAIPSPKAVPSDGNLSIPVDDEHDGKDLVIVLLGPDGNTLSQKKTKFGQS